MMEGGIEFVAVDNPAANKVMLQMLAVFGEYERDQIAARTKAALAAAKSRGVTLGAYGKVLANRHRTAAQEFAEGLRKPVADAIGSGADTLVGIADYLNSMNYRTREDATWSAQTAQKVVQRLGLRTSAMKPRETKGLPML